MLETPGDTGADTALGKHLKHMSSKINLNNKSVALTSVDMSKILP